MGAKVNISVFYGFFFFVIVLLANQHHVGAEMMMKVSSHLPQTKPISGSAALLIRVNFEL